MNIDKHWSLIRRHFKRSVYTNLHVSIASVDENNNPTVTPIGSLFLNKDKTGIYFEKYPSKLPLHAKQNKRICVLSVNSGLLFWFTSLFKLKFKYHPAIKLYGELGIKRKASEEELQKLHKQLSPFRFFKKGYNELWGDMSFVREVTFSKAEMINFGKMTDHLHR